MVVVVVDLSVVFDHLVVVVDLLVVVVVVVKKLLQLGREPNNILKLRVLGDFRGEFFIFRFSFSTID